MPDSSGLSSHTAITAKLRESGSVFAEEEAQLLLSAFDSADELAQMVDQRMSGIPLQIILRWAEFYGLRVAIEPGVFIPRLRSEFLVEQALSVCRADSVVVDLCCGSGAIGMALISTIPDITLYASDNNPTAVQCAIQNIAPLGGTVFKGDLFSALPDELKGRINVLMANAPYVPTGEIEMMPREAREYEPRETLDGGVDGLDVHRRIAKEADAWLAHEGHLLVEASEGQAERLAAIFELNGLEATIFSSDEYDATVVIGAKR